MSAKAANAARNSAFDAAQTTPARPRERGDPGMNTLALHLWPWIPAYAGMNGVGINALGNSAARITIIAMWRKQMFKQKSMIVAAVFLLGAISSAGAQDKVWKHGILEAKSDSGFIAMV